MSFFKKEKKENKKETGSPATISGTRKNTSVFLIKKPWITERAAALTALNKYVFIVEKNATKPEVAKAIESIYGVKTSSVNIINRKSKVRRLGKNIGKISGYKKAIVTLKEGKIDIIPT